MHDCGACSGGCNGCANSLTLTEAEIKMLQTLGQIPFLPIARRAEDPAPIYFEEDARSTEEYTLILRLLEKKGLISLDFDKPLKNFPACSDYPIWGSMALTARGQGVLELLELLGAEES